MNEQNKPRIRLNTKQKSSGEFQIDVTVETDDFAESPEIRANRVIQNINALKKELILAGYKVAGMWGVKLWQ